METQIDKPETQPLEIALATLRNEAKGIVVKTPEDYEKAGRLLVTITNYSKDVKNKLNPFVEFARRGLESARQEMQKYLNGAEEIRAIVSGPMADFKRNERLAAEAEERRINDERRRQAEADALALRKQQEEQARIDREKREKEIKAAQKDGDLNKREAEKMRKEAEAREKEQREQAARDAAAMRANVQTVSVLPGVPKIAGLRARVNWKFRIVDESKLPRIYLIPNEQKIGQMVREIKDKSKSEQACSGIEVYTEDTI